MYFITMLNLTETGKMFKEDSKFLSHGGISIMHPWSYWPDIFLLLPSMVLDIYYDILICVVMLFKEN